MSTDTLLQKISLAFETHDVGGMQEAFENGVNPNAIIKGEPLIYELINMYLRSPRFSLCIKQFVDYGLVFDDVVLLAVLLNNATDLEAEIVKDPSVVNRRYTLNCTFTPLHEATLLHICSEYNLVDAAKILIKHGADVNAKAGQDSYGFGGQSPIFHTVNQHQNLCLEMLQLLLDHDADLNLNVKGLIWGKGYEWETFIPSVNPSSYAMMGLLRQFQRSEQDIYHNVELLMEKQYTIKYKAKNVPNKYLGS